MSVDDFIDFLQDFKSLTTEEQEQLILDKDELQELQELTQILEIETDDKTDITNNDEDKKECELIL